jgi:SAM-dependent methyltransferase
VTELVWAPPHPEDAPPHVDEWDRRRSVATEVFLPWIDRLHPLTGATVLEYGCGTGPVSCAFAPVVGRHIGYDIAADAIKIAQRKTDGLGAGNVELHAVDALQILDAVSERRGEPDVVLLYAVLEHMTVQERLRLLELAFEIVKPGGLIAVVETPNRLAPVDWHTSFLPYQCQLPDELALETARRSRRRDFVEALDAAADEGPEEEREALTRWGRGVSYHEFELVLGDVTQYVLAGGYEPELLEERPVHPEELALARQLERFRPDLPPVFSRYWLDLALSPERFDARKRRLIWPWMIDTRESPGAAWTHWECVELLGGGALRIELPCPTRRLIVTASFPESHAEMTVKGNGFDVRRVVAATPGHQSPVEFELPVAQDVLLLELNMPAYVHFVGYDAPGVRPRTSFAP